MPTACHCSISSRPAPITQVGDRDQLARLWTQPTPRHGLPVGPLVILVHIASVWVPFTSASRRRRSPAIDEEILKEIRARRCKTAGASSATHIRKGKRLASEFKKRNYIETYIPHIGQALKEILEICRDTQTKKTVDQPDRRPPEAAGSTEMATRKKKATTKKSATRKPTECKATARKATAAKKTPAGKLSKLDKLDHRPASIRHGQRRVYDQDPAARQARDEVPGALAVQRALRPARRGYFQLGRSSQGTHADRQHGQESSRRSLKMMALSARRWSLTDDFATKREAYYVSKELGRSQVQRAARVGCLHGRHRGDVQRWTASTASSCGSFPKSAWWHGRPAS